MNNPFRDFIYLDFDRILSIYSQLEGSLSTSVVNESVQGILHGKQASAPSGTNVREEADTVTRRTEVSVLHDHVYSILEERLADEIVDGNSIVDRNLELVVEQGRLISVHGSSKLQDYSYLSDFVGNFNHIGKHMASMTSGEVLSRRSVDNRASRRRQKSKGNSGEEQKLNRALEETGLRMNPAFLESIVYLTNRYQGNSYEVLVKAKQSEIRFRGVLDKASLRYSPDKIRALYGDRSEVEWHMLGIATAIRRPKDQDETPGQKDSEDSPDPQESNGGNLADAYEVMFDHARDLERIWRATEATELVLAPLAIYRDFGRSLPPTK